MTGMEGLIIGMIVGAIVGGISAAMSGGDIMNGMLVGAIGGAVMGGITMGVSSLFGGASGGAMSNSQYLAASATASEQTGTNIGTQVAKSSAQEGATSGGFSWSNLGSSLFAGEGGGIGGALAQGALTIGGNILKSKDAAEEAAKAREHASAEAQASREAQMSMQAGNIEAEQGMWDKRLAQQESEFSREMTERRRQFDVPIAEAEEKRQRQRGVLAQINTARQGYLDPTAQGIDVQAAQGQSQLLAAKQGDTSTTLDEEIQTATGAAYA